MKRLNLIKNQLNKKDDDNSDDEVVIVGYSRTPFTSWKTGELKTVPPELLVKNVLYHTLRKSNYLVTIDKENNTNNNDNDKNDTAEEYNKSDIKENCNINISNNDDNNLYSQSPSQDNDELNVLQEAEEAENQNQNEIETITKNYKDKNNCYSSGAAETNSNSTYSTQLNSNSNNHNKKHKEDEDDIDILLKKYHLNPKLEINELIISNSLLPLGGYLSGQIGFSLINKENIYKTNISTSNGVFVSGLNAITRIFNAIKANKDINTGISLGFESFSQMKKKDLINPEMNFTELFDNQTASNIVLPYGIQAEIINAKHNITKTDIANYSINSHLKAHEAYKKGLLKNETEAVVITQTKINKNEIRKEKIRIETDGNISLLRKTKPLSFNSILNQKSYFISGRTYSIDSISPVSDGAGAVLIARRKYCIENKLPVLCCIKNICFGYAMETFDNGNDNTNNREKLEDTNSVFGQVFAVRKLLKKSSLSIDNIDFFEINETFCGVTILTSRELGLNLDRVNVNGGNIAYGECMSAVDLRLLMSCVNCLVHYKKRYGVVVSSLNLSSGVALLLENQNWENSN